MGIWTNRQVFLTGHTGFKGSWLAQWLVQSGAQVTGYSLQPPTAPNLFDKANVRELVDHIEGDIRDLAALERAVDRARPEVILHLAAQSLVRQSYIDPVDTYSTNVMGTVHVLDVARRVPGIRAVVCVTSDKCYENREWVWPYRENDPMGGFDPYSSSKGCSELVAAAYRNAFFRKPQANTVIGSVRAGNVIGGGDWAADRLVPDIVRALEAGAAPRIRAPDSIRPWQHVLDALSGYLLLAEKMLSGEHTFGQAWNFGPAEDDVRPVRWVVERMIELWGGGQGWVRPAGEQPHEAHVLKLDSSKARRELGWRPRIGLDKAIEWIVEWHRRVAKGEDAGAVCRDQIMRYAELRHATNQI